MLEKDPSIHTPYTDEELLKILTQIIEMVPEHCRIIRILRDFPSDLILKGSKTTNLRQIIERRGVNSRDIRAREIKGQEFDDDKVELVTREYRANDGNEYFITFEATDIDKLIGLVRLRLPDKCIDFLPEIKDCALIRELHVYGTQKTLDKDKENSLRSKTQHKGYGRRLMQAAEDIARDQGWAKIAVISAVGTREYYKKLGYTQEGTYMVKQL